MDDIAALADAIYREKVARARVTPIEVKMLGGGNLFMEVCERMRWGICSQFPDYNEEQITAELDRRLALRRKLEMLGDRL